MRACCVLVLVSVLVSASVLVWKSAPTLLGVGVGRPIDVSRTECAGDARVVVLIRGPTLQDNERRGETDDARAV